MMNASVGTATKLGPILRQTSVRYSTRCQARSSFSLTDVRARECIALLLHMKLVRHGNRDMMDSDLTSRKSDLTGEIAYGTDCRATVASEITFAFGVDSQF